MIKFINILVLQWFCVRLTKNTETRIEKFDILSYDIMFNSNISARGIGDTSTYEWYSLQYFILPLTGWYNKFN